MLVHCHIFMEMHLIFYKRARSNGCFMMLVKLIILMAIIRYKHQIRSIHKVLMQKIGSKKKSQNYLIKVDTVFCCTQEAGDIVFIPDGYCHAVLNKTEVMGIVFETR